MTRLLKHAPGAQRSILTMAVCKVNELLFTGGVGGLVTTWRLHRFPDDKRKGPYHITRLGNLNQRDGRCAGVQAIQEEG